MNDERFIVEWVSELGIKFNRRFHYNADALIFIYETMINLHPLIKSVCIIDRDDDSIHWFKKDKSQ
jgi:hypothetical protein